MTWFLFGAVVGGVCVLIATVCVLVVGRNREVEVLRLLMRDAWFEGSAAYSRWVHSDYAGPVPDNPYAADGEVANWDRSVLDGDA